ncbi:hypothetical protein DRW41_22080 [Neobacillus piezotolerans]|uniref:Uncharacterized protein n=1 Tax=Neobacillus piezotolerans TaxID=2259171 RepID=A0A3D8GKS9_9BACI|nr:hypothetical protein [Neobacillus piezotolerans]RDU34716.1 hypothetical protein DRW41_22080 [Neobacillus piezotolerans]
MESHIDLITIKKICNDDQDDYRLGAELHDGFFFALPSEDAREFIGLLAELIRTHKDLLSLVQYVPPEYEEAE